jgi:hypothetical protein
MSVDSVHVELFPGHLIGQNKLLILANQVTVLLILANQVTGLLILANHMSSAAEGGLRPGSICLYSPGYWFRFSKVGSPFIVN